MLCSFPFHVHIYFISCTYPGSLHFDSIVWSGFLSLTSFSWFLCVFGFIFVSCRGTFMLFLPSLFPFCCLLSFSFIFISSFVLHAYLHTCIHAACITSDSVAEWMAVRLSVAEWMVWCMTEWTHTWMSESMSGRRNEWTIGAWTRRLVNEWANPRMHPSWVNGTIEWMNEWTN